MSRLRWEGEFCAPACQSWPLLDLGGCVLLVYLPLSLAVVTGFLRLFPLCPHRPLPLSLHHEQLKQILVALRLPLLPLVLLHVLENLVKQ